MDTVISTTVFLPSSWDVGMAQFFWIFSTTSRAHGDRSIWLMLKEAFPGEYILAPYVSVDGDLPKGRCVDVSDERYLRRSSSSSVRCSSGSGDISLEGVIFRLNPELSSGECVNLNPWANSGGGEGALSVEPTWICGCEPGGSNGSASGGLAAGRMFSALSGATLTLRPERSLSIWGMSRSFWGVMTTSVTLLSRGISIGWKKIIKASRRRI